MSRTILFFFFLSLILNAQEPAHQSQQKAVSHLVQALKSVRLAIINGEGSPDGKGDSEQKTQPKNPFQDKQKFKLPDMPADKNAYNQLSELVKEQKKLNSEIRKNTEDPNGKLAQKQDSHQKKLDPLKQKFSENPTASGKLAKAGEEMKEASEYLKAEKRVPASAKGEQAAADLEQVRKSLEKDSNQATGKTLGETGKKLEKLSEKLKNGKQTANKTLDELSEMSMDLAEKAVRQHENGTQSNAERLGKVAERVHDAAESKPESKLSETEKEHAVQQTLDTLKKVVQAAKSNQQDPVSFLSSTLAQLNDNANYLKYLKKHSDPAAEKEVREELNSLLDDLSSVLERIAEESVEWNVVKAREAVEKAMADLEKNKENFSEKLTPVLDSAGKLLLALKREVRTHVFEAEEVPEKYRRDAADYFERLSGRKSSSTEKP